MTLKANSKKILDIVAGQPNQNATQAYREVHPTATPNTAMSNAYKLMQKPEARIYLEKHSEQAKSTVVELMAKGHKDETRLNAAKDVLDRQFGRAVQQVQATTTSVSLSIDLTGALTEK